MKKTWYAISAKADKSAEISIFDEIGMWGVTAKDFIAELRQLDAAAIELSINSPGGSVFDALAIYNALRQHAAEIHVTVMGVAASAASLVAMAGDRIVMPENTFMMVHNPIGIVFGNSEDMRDLADTLDKIGASLVATYVSRTGQSEEQIRTLLDAETWLSAAEAKELGFCDEVQPALKIAAAFDLERLPENVRAALGDKSAQPGGQPAMFGDTIAEPGDTLAQQIRAAADAAGLGEHVAAWLLDGTLSDMASATAAIAEAREIRDLCQFADAADQAAGFIRARTSLADVRAALINARAQAADAQPTDGHQPSGGARAASPGARAVTALGDVYARNRSNARKAFPRMFQ